MYAYIALNMFVIFMIATGSHNENCTTEGNLRLDPDDESSQNGYRLLQVCHIRQWGNVCDSPFSENDERFVFQQLQCKERSNGMLLVLLSKLASIKLSINILLLHSNKQCLKTKHILVFTTTWSLTMIHVSAHTFTYYNQRSQDVKLSTASYI